MPRGKTARWKKIRAQPRAYFYQLERLLSRNFIILMLPFFIIHDKVTNDENLRYYNNFEWELHHLCAWCGVIRCQRCRSATLFRWGSRLKLHAHEKTCLNLRSRDWSRGPGRSFSCNASCGLDSGNTFDQRFHSFIHVWKPCQSYIVIASGMAWFARRSRSAFRSCLAFGAFFLKCLSNAFTAATERRPADNRYIALITWFQRSNNAKTAKERVTF